MKVETQKSICAFISSSACFIKLGALMFGAYIFTIISLPAGLFPSSV
jgi:hypothetical protein